MMSTLSKKELRTELKRRNLALGAEARCEASRTLFRSVETLPQFAAARCVALFASLDDEPSTSEMFARWSQSKSLVVPKVEGGQMRFYAYNAATTVRGAYGIAEPGMGARLCDPSEIDLMIVPGMGFTADGCRLGRGKGFYDKYLTHHAFRGLKVGVGYHHQLLDALPIEPHDVMMDMVFVG